MIISPQTELQMLPAESRYSKRRWFCTIASLLLYIVDIATDIRLAVKYVEEGQLLWAVLTFSFVLVGLMATQIFSYAWYIDDMKNEALNLGGKAIKSGLVCVGLMSVHVLGMGIFTR
ncbi:hypothetical protein CRUP_013064 [Coryphaenoides rupestris]|nr:hypothetical protein CRUP_013064 [Coryphaenoides rupestris]